MALGGKFSVIASLILFLGSPGCNLIGPMGSAALAKWSVISLYQIPVCLGCMLFEFAANNVHF